MHRRPSTSLLLAPALVATIGSGLGLTALLAPAIAAAQAPPGGEGPKVPGAESFDIRYYLTTADGKRGRPMAATDFVQFVNKARCECGHQIETQIRLKSTQGMAYDTMAQISTFIGTMCAIAEVTPLGQYRPCVRLQTATSDTYVQGLNQNFHPVWLTTGVANASEDRDPDTAFAAGSCDSGFGQAGVWMCADTNGSVGCQSDEFFITGAQNNNLPAGMSSGIAYDFTPPITNVEDVKPLSGDSAVVIQWDVRPGDINGFRVLCEEADTGKPPPGKGMDPPALDRIPNGTIYYTTENLCGKKPFSTFKRSSSPLDPPGGSGTDTGATSDDSASDADTGGTDGTDGTDGTSGSGSGTDTGVSLTCGDGVVDAGEDCDDGADNGDDKSCHSNCRSDVCGDGLKGPDEPCDNGDANDDEGLCRTDCTLNVSEGLLNLDWSYVCSDHLAYNTNSVRIEGLENDKRYNFLLVSYDKAGNPKAFERVITATPVNTRDLWEQCEAQGGVCGESGFCNVAGRSDNLLALGGLLGLGLGLGGLIRRNRKKRA